MKFKKFVRFTVIPYFIDFLGLLLVCFFYRSHTFYNSIRTTRTHKIIKEVINLLINVDFDGVIGDNLIEDFFFENSIDDYIRLAVENPRKLNIPLLKHLEGLKKGGHVLKLWTNRNDDLKKATIKNLDNWKSLFDSFLFLNGYKVTTQVEGIVIDNHPKYLKCGEIGIHYPTFY